MTTQEWIDSIEHAASREYANASTDEERAAILADLEAAREQAR